MDSLEFSELSLDMEEARVFRMTTLERVSKYLALDTKTPYRGIDATLSNTRNSILEEFGPVGHAAVQICTMSKALPALVISLDN